MVGRIASIKLKPLQIQPKNNPLLKLHSKAKRQIEILGLCLTDPEARQRLGIMDLAALFGVEPLTIKRDLKELRAYGIKIHSTKKKGVCVTPPVSEKQVRSLILRYLGLCFSENSIDQSATLMVKKLGEKSLAHVVALQRSIETHTVAVIDYEKESGRTEQNREVRPLRLYQSDNLWRLLASHDGQVKQYLLNKIHRVRQTKKKFDTVQPEEIEEYFQYSWRSWTGTERHNVKLRLSSDWAQWLLPRQLNEVTVSSKKADGSVVLDTVVNSLEEMAVWIVSHGKGVKVLEPESLKKLVIDLAKGVLANYNE